MWATAAPARAASMAALAMSSGRTGTCVLRPVVSPAPVTAQVMNASQFTGISPLGWSFQQQQRHLVRRLQGVPPQPGQPLPGDPLARPPDVDDDHRPAEPVEDAGGDAVGELL